MLQINPAPSTDPVRPPDLMMGNVKPPAPAPAFSEPAPAPSSTDPVLAAFLQQMEYTKQAPLNIGSQASKVTVLPQQQGGGNSAVLVVVVVAVVGIGAFFLLRGKKGGHKEKGGAQKIESNH